MLHRSCFMLVLSLVLVGCVASPAPEASVDYVENASQIVSDANWDNMQEMTVTLTEFSFEPSQLTFQVNTPYKLSIANEGSEKHYFTSVDFFKAIATRKVQSQDGEIKAPYFKALEVFPGHSLDLYFIPVETGSYDLLCTIPGHKENGMEGTIVIE